MQQERDRSREKGIRREERRGGEEKGGEDRMEKKGV